ncbi:MAG TPA: hypothetical protein VMU98_01885 [Acidimicrobiales bacterium]|nr:hypothetical protein [Acidimicrobiales bacterium]
METVISEVQARENEYVAALNESAPMTRHHEDDQTVKEVKLSSRHGDDHERTLMAMRKSSLDHEEARERGSR